MRNFLYHPISCKPVSVVLLSLALVNCGDDNSNAAATNPAGAPTPVTTPSPAPAQTPNNTEVMEDNLQSALQVEVAQSFLQPIGNKSTFASQRLVPGKDAWVRVSMMQKNGATRSPQVLMDIIYNNQLNQTITLSTQSNAGDPIGVPGNQYFWGKIPSSLVKQGLTLRFRVANSPINFTKTPVIGSPTKLTVRIVPITLKDITGKTFGASLPTQANLQILAKDLLPFPTNNITFKFDKGFTSQSTKLGRGGLLSTDGKEIDAALDELEDYRQATSTDNREIYSGNIGYGTANGGVRTVGIGYVSIENALGLSHVTAVNYENPLSYYTLAHELGHNFSLLHTSCGTDGVDIDPQYPYSGGSLGSSVIFDATFEKIIPANDEFDLMGYCNGIYFSDYNYYKFQRYAERYFAATTAQKTVANTRTPHMSVSINFTSLNQQLNSGLVEGTLLDNTIAPKQLLDRAPIEPAGTLHDLAILATYQDGTSSSVPINIVQRSKHPTQRIDYTQSSANLVKILANLPIKATSLIPLPTNKALAQLAIVRPKDGSIETLYRLRLPSSEPSEKATVQLNLTQKSLTWDKPLEGQKITLVGVTANQERQMIIFNEPITSSQKLIMNDLVKFPQYIAFLDNGWKSTILNVQVQP